MSVSRNIIPVSGWFISRSVLNCMLSMVLLLLVAGPAFAQPDLPEGVVPPPLVFVSEREQKKLDLETKIKNRTKLSIELMETRISIAESFSSDEDFKKSLVELGHFKGLMQDAMSFLGRHDHKKGILKNYKRFEIGLREFIPRLNLLRREYPLSHSYHVGTLIDALKQTREDSVEKFFGNTVLDVEK